MTGCLNYYCLVLESYNLDNQNSVFGQSVLVFGWALVPPPASPPFFVIYWLSASESEMKQTRIYSIKCKVPGTKQVSNLSQSS